MHITPTNVLPFLLLLGTTHAHPPPPRDLDARAGPAALVKRVTCGSGAGGSCPAGQCCSEAGFCGTGEDYCKGPGCQISFSDGNCDASKPPAGQTTENVPRPHVGNVPYGTVLTTCTRPGLVALTFDDGPSEYTSELLDILEDTSTPATFFITGNSAGKGMISSSSTPWPPILRRMHSAGHQMASHTWTHENLELASDSLRQTQVVYNEMAFRNIFGFFPTYLRPPYAACYNDGCLAFLDSLGYHVANFNLDTKDYLHDSPLEILTSKDTFSAALGGDSSPSKSSFVVLVHDTHEQTVRNLIRYMIDTLKTEGYKAVTLGECLDDPRENWYRDASGTSSGGGSTTTATATATSTDSTGLVASKDGTCGVASGGKYTCLGAEQGNCCSTYGFCGSTSAYCDGGCQKGFGNCNSNTEIIVSANGKCGADVGQTCAGSTYGRCCSSYGFCGASADYCGSECQGEFGSCS
jgi:peptidoglycan/xylan/chitin deacetylase (PgdA/CDA1 family)